MKDFDHWFMAGLMVMIAGLLVFSMLTYSEVIANRMKISEISGAMEIKTVDRYRASDARRDFEAIRALIETDKAALDVAVKTRDEKFAAIEKRLAVIEMQLKKLEATQ